MVRIFSCVMSVVVVLISDSASSGSRVMRGWDAAGWNTTIIEDLETRFGTLLGPEETPGWCFLVDRFWPWLPNAFRLWAWWCPCGVGVWLCVECCIVDASILLW